VLFQAAPLRTCVPYALGWLYGMDVAALGGRMMGKRLRDQLGIGPHNGGSFFDGYGADTHTMWERLATVINHRIVIEDDLTAACDGAVDFFEALIDWLSLPCRAAA
jgi:heme oxygenase